MGLQELEIDKELPQVTNADLERLCCSREVVLYEGLVLDVTEFNHPGGHALIQGFLKGQPLQQQFDAVSHSLNAKRMLRHFAVGRLCSQAEANYVFRKHLQCEELAVHQHLQQRLKLDEPILQQVECFTYEELVSFLRFPKFVEEGQEIRLHNDAYEDQKRKNDFWVNMLFCWTFVGLLIGSTLYHTTLQTLALTIANFLFGVLKWTLIEYYFHRFLLHQQQDAYRAKPDRFMQIVDGHGIHHAFPQYRPVIVINIPKIVTYSVGIYLSLIWIFSSRCTLAILSGVITGLTCYDALHYWIHFGWRTSFKPLLSLQRSHLKHHYKDTTRGFGVSSTLWDNIFGTTHL